MTVTDTLHDLDAPADSPMPPTPRRHDPGPASPYPPYWLVRDRSGTEIDDVGRGILERAIYVSARAGPSDHQAAVEVITEELCRWAHPDDIRWCHLPDSGTGGYTIVGRAIRGVCRDDDLDDDPD